jgi:uncharacterized DUF497 family protein
VKIAFDPTKSARNAEERGLPFDLVAEFDWEGAVSEEDARFNIRSGDISPLERSGIGFTWCALRQLKVAFG